MNTKHCFIFYPTKIGATEQPIRDYISSIGEITSDSPNRIECMATTPLHTLGKRISAICKDNHLIGVVVDFPKPYFLTNSQKCSIEADILLKKDGILLDDMIGRLSEELEYEAHLLLNS